MSGPCTSTHGLQASLDALQQGEVHLWWGRIGDVESLDGSRAWLSDEERRRGERFHRERDARAFLFRRAFLRAVLAGYAGSRPEELAFVTGAYGKPSLAPPHARLGFNAASRAGTVLIGVTVERALGVDVELHPSPFASDPEEIARLARRVATEPERERLLALPVERRARAFLALWTRKEALLKALGTGLSREPGTVAVGWGEGECDARVLGEGVEPRWLAVTAPAGVVASVVVAAQRGERIEVREGEWAWRAGERRV